MRNTLTFILAIGIALFTWQCNTAPAGTTIKGTITGASNMQVFIDKVIIGQASNVLDKTDISGNGSFSITFPDGLEPGIYNMRIGAQRINLVLDGTESEVEINANLNQLQSFDFNITGSDDSQALVQLMRGLTRRQFGIEDISNIVDTASNPVLGAFVAYSALTSLANSNNVNMQEQGLNIQREALATLRNAQPNSDLTNGYEQHVATLEAQYNQLAAMQKIRVGEPAPDIKLPSPDGKEYSLSDLKGKVVLLDFWASWCRPCRMENPNVVKVYQKYKDQGFTVFSVSLDRPGQKARWEDAIQKDGLAWPYHVSDLQYWNSPAAKMYGVSGIPRAFMIDRDGNIASTSVRGAEQIEAELKKLL